MERATVAASLAAVPAEAQPRGGSISIQQAKIGWPSMIIGGPAR